MTDALPILAAEVVADNAELKARVQSFIHTMLDEAETILEYAPPQVKAQMLRSFFPDMLKALRDEKEDESLAILRAEMLELHAEMRADIERNIAGPVLEGGDDDLPEG